MRLALNYRVNKRGAALTLPRVFYARKNFRKNIRFIYLETEDQYIIMYTGELYTIDISKESAQASGASEQSWPATVNNFLSSSTARKAVEQNWAGKLQNFPSMNSFTAAKARKPKLR